MAFVDLIGKELSGHQALAVYFWSRNDTSGTMTNALALQILERIADRPLTALEQTQLLAFVNAMDTADAPTGGADYTHEAIEHTQVLLETDDITGAQGKAMLGIT